MVVLLGRSCPSSDTVDCVALNVTTNIAYYGDEPTSFPETLERSLLFWDWDEIVGYRGFGDVGVLETESGDEPSGESNSTNTTTDGGDVSGVERGASQDPEGVNPGAFVAIGVAAVTLLLVGVFVMQRRTNNTNTKGMVGADRAVQLTDDEVDDDLNRNITMHEGSFDNDDRPNTTINTMSYVLSDEEDAPDNIIDPEVISAVKRESTRKDDSYYFDDEGTEITPIHEPDQPPSLTKKGPPPVMVDTDVSLDESSYYKYPARHIVSHRITSYDSEFKSMNETNNSRSYKIPDDTVDL